MATILKVVKSRQANSGLAINPINFSGAVISAAGRMEVNFEKTTGGASGTTMVDLNITNGATGVEQKRVFQALANALGGHPRHGAVVELANALTGKFIHQDITGVEAVNL